MANPALEPVTLHLPKGDLEAYRQQAQAQGVTLEALLILKLQASPPPTLEASGSNLRGVTVEDIKSGQVQPKTVSRAQRLNRQDPFPDEDTGEMLEEIYASRRQKAI